MGSVSVKRWDVCLAYVGFEDAEDFKTRPVLILGETALLLDALMMTGQPPRPGEYALKYWAEAGLHKQTAVRVSKRLRLSEEAVIKKIGSLQPADILEIEKIILSEPFTD